MQGTNAEFERFFDSYQSVWLATRDGRKIAQFYHAPLLTLRGDGSFVALQTEEEVADFFHALADAYFRQGIERWERRDFHVDPLGWRSAIATMTWTASRTDGMLVRQWRQSYNLVRFGDAWKIVLSTLHVNP